MKKIFMLVILPIIALGSSSGHAADQKWACGTVKDHEGYNNEIFKILTHTVGKNDFGSSQYFLKADASQGEQHRIGIANLITVAQNKPGNFCVTGHMEGNYLIVEDVYRQGGIGTLVPTPARPMTTSPL
jgi:hypothetical protein